MTYIKLPNQVFKMHLPSEAVITYLALASHANRLGGCIVSQGRLGSLVGRSPDSIQRSITVLQQAGLVSVTHRFGLHGHRRSNSYTLTPLSGRFTKVPAAVFSYGLSKLQLVVYLYLLSRRAGRCLEAIPSLSEMVSTLRMSKRSVVDAVRILQRLCLLSKTNYWRRDGGLGRNRHLVLTAKLRSFLLLLIAHKFRKKEKRTALCERVIRPALRLINLSIYKIYDMLPFVKGVLRPFMFFYKLGVVLLCGMELYPPWYVLLKRKSKHTFTLLVNRQII